MSEAVTTKMIAALDLEIKAIKRQGGSTSIEVRGGERKGTAEGNVLYAFPVAEELHIRDEAPIRVAVGQEEVDGVIVSLSEEFLLVVLERDLGPKIAFARLIVDDSFLIERLKKRMEEVLADGKFFNHEKANQTIGEQPFRTAEAQVDETLLQGREQLDDQKKKAIAKALGSDVVYLWGPPGTGKTTVLARIVEGYYRKGLSVLVVSNTNVAVDTALEMIADRLTMEAEFHQGAVLRYGPVVKPELEHKYRDHVVIDHVVARLGRALQVEKEALERETADAEAKTAPLRQAIYEIERLEEAKRSLAYVEAKHRETEVKQHSTRSAIASITQKIRSLKFDLQRAHGMGSIRRLIAGLNPERLTRVISKAEVERVAQEDLLTAISEQIKQARDDLRTAKQQVDTLGSLISHYPTHRECKQKLESLDKQIAERGGKIQEIQKQLDALRDEVIARCKILATTVYRTYLKGQVERAFDAVVVDEASMLALPMAFYVAGLASRHVVVAGDFRQLPPIIMSDDPVAIQWLKRDVFEKAGIAEAVGRRESPEALVGLKVQYRMCDDICSVINEIFYSDHPLETSASVRNQALDDFPLGQPALLYVDTGPQHPWTALRLGTYSRYNVLHALLLRNVTCYLNERGYLPPAGSLNEKLGIVAPYGAQTSLIQRLLDERLDGRGTKFAATVHRFQGNQKNTMLIDLTDSLGVRPSKFMRASNLHEEGARLLNVALSRARYHIVLVANFDYLRQKVGSRSIVMRVLDFFERAGNPLNVEELLPLGPEDWFDGLRPLDPPRIEFDPSSAGAFTEGTFYPAFLGDLRQANRSIVIFSPFLTSRGTTRWIDILRAKLAQGLRIRLVTRPPGTMGGILERGLEELIAEIIQIGVVVDQRAAMHEKFAIIDNAILWHGSLNIFSHHGTTESMLRIPSMGACQQMTRFVTSPVGRGPGKEEEEVELAGRENPECPNCSGMTVWKSGRYGIYFECAAGCGTKIDPRRAISRQRRRPDRTTRKARKGRRSSKQIVSGRVCSKCGSPMIQRTGKHGPFLGCASYPRCRHTEAIP